MIISLRAENAGRAGPIVVTSHLLATDASTTGAQKHQCKSKDRTSRRPPCSIDFVNLHVEKIALCEFTEEGLEDIDRDRE